MKTTIKSSLLGLLLCALSFGQLIFPYSYQNRTPSPNAPGGACFINTQPVYNYLLGTYWFCLPNTSAPFNLGTWTTYTPPNGVLAMNGAGTISLATAAQIGAIGLTGLTSAITPSVAGGALIGTAALPMNGLVIGTAATNNATITASSMSAARAITLPDPGGAATLAFTNPTTAQTITNTTLTSPVITGPAPVACGATCSPTAGQLSTCSVSTGCTFTIPTATGTGNVVRMKILTTTAVSGGEKVLLTTTTDVIIGYGIGENSGTNKTFVGNAITAHSIQMPFSGSQPSGGFAGDTITCTDVGAALWACDILYQAGTTPTTPYSNATT